MRTYVLDEISRKDMVRVREWVAERADLSGVEDLYWINFQPDMLSATQHDHKDCQPHCFAIELGQNYVKFELLIRSRNNYRCRTCPDFASPQQRRFILEFADRLVHDLDLLT
jgi:hypothetical protein